jgi:hypothetical protein
MKKKKLKGKKKAMSKRIKKSKVASVQSVGDKGKSYLLAIDHISNYSSKINSIQSSLAQIGKPLFQPNILNAIAGFQKQFSAFNDFQNMLPKTNHLKGLGHLGELTRSTTLAFSSLSKSSAIETIAKTFAGGSNFDKQQQIIQGTLLSNSYFRSLQIPEITKSFETIARSHDFFTFGLQSSLVKATELNLFAEKSLSVLNWSNLGSRIGITKEEKTALEKSFFGFSTGFSNLLKTYEKDEGKIIATNPLFIKIPSAEFFTSSNLIEAISTEDQISSEEEIVKTDIQYENEYSLSTWLPKIDSKILNLWKGAVEALNSKNSDRIRHFVTSIRELYTHVLHVLAPDDQIIAWTSKPEYFSDGKPTRRARLYYICRNISSAPFSKFVDKDIEATIAFIDLFQKGTHEIDPKFSENHLTTIKCKAETTLRFILEIHFTTNN